MKDAKGHGSDAHSSGVNKIGQQPNVWHTIRDAHGDSVYGSVLADQGDQRVGHISYEGILPPTGQHTGGEVHVQMIETSPEFRRQGIATAMMDRLKQEWPGAKINWGMMTPEGTAFKRAYSKK